MNISTFPRYATDGNYGNSIYVGAWVWLWMWYMYQRVDLDIENVAYVHCDTADISTEWNKKETCQTTVWNSFKQISLLAKCIDIHRRITIEHWSSVLIVSATDPMD